jgi:hypothetical protein
MPLQASNVKMYETHNPGFCYKRNGEHRLQQILEVPPPVDFEVIADISKVYSKIKKPPPVALGW